MLTTSGTTKRVRVYGATRAEVHIKLTEAKAKSQQGIPTADKNWLLGDYLDYWLAEVVKPNRRPSTYELYEVNVRLHLKPGLGHTPLKRLTVSMVQRFLNKHITEGHSVRKVQILREVLSPALSRAMREELITRNVARLVELPRHQVDDVKPWTPKEVTRFLEAAKEHKWYPAFLLASIYGLRRGEVIGLRWQDVDFVHGELHVRQQLLRANGILQFGPLKTQAGRRDLPLLAMVANELSEHRERRVKTDDNDLVFTSSSGGPIEPYNFTRAFQTICARHKLRRIKLHHLRHAAATNLKDLGVPARDAQLILGHSNIAITQQIYQHDTMDSRRESLRLMEGAVLPLVHDNTSTEGVDGYGSRQLSRQTPKSTLATLLGTNDHEKTPRLLGAFSWLGWRGSNPRMHGPKLSTSRLPRTWTNRITEVDAALQDLRRVSLLGSLAVSAAVKDLD
ncbi:tyrosine-type recombinase/integrase [Streptomyces dysideae]|uniref:tyrosine-type recombinase/integrase n=1 Tax=Streptomyces dysideae TaxID=909626 RepID=UPI00131C1AA3|nr:site-specific integrase [Streptomyces dysideae]